MNALLAQFLEEGAELLESVEEGLLVLERDPSDPEMLNAVFRAAHTFKGSAGLFSLTELIRLTHACEDVLDRARSGALTLSSDVIDQLNLAFDLVRSWLDHLAATEELPSDAAARSNERVHALRAVLDEPTDPTAADPAESGDEEVEPLWRIVYTPSSGALFRGDDPLALVSQIPDLLALDVEPRAPWPSIDDLDEYDCTVVFTALSGARRDELEFLFRFVADEVTMTREARSPEQLDPAHELVAMIEAQRKLLRSVGTPEGFDGRVRSAAAVVRRALEHLGQDTARVTTAEASSLTDLNSVALEALIDEVLTGLHSAGAPAPEATEESGSVGGAAVSAAPGAMARPLKVDQAKVDRLLELAGELVVAKNALPFLAREAEETYGVTALARQIKDQYAAMNRLAEELQHAVMDIRMLPVSVAWQRFPRLVRDLSRKLGKQVRLVTEGEHTQADKDVLELLGDPLLHLVRNSLDHGLETPEERRTAGKPAEGTLRLTAAQEADSVLIRIIDDGRGIDPDSLRRKALTRGLISAEQAERMSDREALYLIFLAGFSTAEQISDLSGRGVGMDVVRSTIVRLGGEVAVESSLGAGTQITIKLPLTMSVMSVMTVSAGGQKFGIPLDLVRETVKVPRAQIGSIQRRDTIALRRGLVPVIDLAAALSLPRNDETPELTVCVVRIGADDVGLAIDKFHENTDVILKPLEGVMRGLTTYAGTALLGDGDVLLVLDAPEVVRRAAA